MAPPSSFRFRRASRHVFACLGVVTLVASCGGDDDAGQQGWINAATEPADESVPSSDESVPSSDEQSTATTDLPDVSSAPGVSLAPDVSAPPDVSSAPDVSAPPSSATPTTIDPADVAHAFPVDPDVHSSWTPEAHANYRATDIFASSGCGTRLLAPVTGVVDEVLENTYDANVDDPALRGGNGVSIIGDDGVRYWMAHFQLIDPAVVPGARVTAGDYLGEMGDTGRVSACSLHFGLSLDCPGAAADWWVRRGVIWPDAYLESWRNGENLSPLPALQDWFTEYPNACNSVEDTPYPVA